VRYRVATRRAPGLAGTEKPPNWLSTSVKAFRRPYQRSRFCSLPVQVEAHRVRRNRYAQPRVVNEAE